MTSYVPGVCSVCKGSTWSPSSSLSVVIRGGTAAQHWVWEHFPKPGAAEQELLLELSYCEHRNGGEIVS